LQVGCQGFEPPHLQKLGEPRSGGVLAYSMQHERGLTIASSATGSCQSLRWRRSAAARPIAEAALPNAGSCSSERWKLLVRTLEAARPNAGSCSSECWKLLVRMLEAARPNAGSCSSERWKLLVRTRKAARIPRAQGARRAAGARSLLSSVSTLQWVRYLSPGGASRHTDTEGAGVRPRRSSRPCRFSGMPSDVLTTGLPRRQPDAIPSHGQAPNRRVRGRDDAKPRPR